MEITVNYWAVLVAAIASMVVGSVWYGVLFRKSWMEMMGLTPDSMKEMNMTVNKAYLIQFIASLLMAYVLDHTLIYASAFTGASGLRAGLMVGFWNWLGFIAPITLGVVLWEGKPWKLWCLNASNYLVSLLLMGVVLSAWQ